MVLRNLSGIPIHQRYNFCLKDLHPTVGAAGGHQVPGGREPGAQLISCGFHSDLMAFEADSLIFMGLR